MKPSLLPHQIRALERLHETGGKQLLHIGCGGGKTLTTLMYLKGKNTKRVLVIAPATLLSVWDDEAKKWLGFSFTKIKGSPEARKKIYQQGTDGFFVVGYEIFLKDWKIISTLRFDAVVAEESHRMKSPTAKVTKAILKFSSKIPIRIALTGTVIPGGWKDVWSQVNFISPGAMYGNFYVWRQIHCLMPIPNCPAITGYRDIEKIKQDIQPFVFTVPKEEIDKNLPPATFQNITFELSPKERKYYDQLKNDLILQISADETLTVANALGLILRLRQAVNGLFVFGMDVPSSKLQVLKDLIDTFDPEEKVIIFTMFAETAYELKKNIPEAFVVSGETKDKDEVVAVWKAKGRILVGTKSLSEGWNLQEARIVINFDLPYTNAEYIQRYSRVLRGGQQRSVIVYNLIAEKTVDAHVQKILEKKKDMENLLNQWTKADIDELLQ